MWFSCFADRPAKSDQVEMQRKAFPFRDERSNPLMSLVCVHPYRNEAEMLPHPQDMGVDWEGFSPHAKKKETMSRLWTDSFETSDRLHDLFRIHFLQKGEAQLSVMFLNPAQGFTDAPCLLMD
jgi:hypothetical protein